MAFILLGLSLGTGVFASPQSCYYPSAHKINPALLVQGWIANAREHADKTRAVDCAKLRFNHLRQDIFDYQRREANPLTRAFLEPNEFALSRALLLNQFADDIDLLLENSAELSEEETLQLRDDVFEITTKILKGKGQLANLDVLSNRYLVGATRIVRQFNDLHLGYARAYTLDNDRNYRYFHFVVTVYEDNLILSQNLID